MCGTPAYLSLISIEPRNKDEGKVWGVLNPATPGLTTLDQVLTFPGQVRSMEIVAFLSAYIIPTFSIYLLN